MSSGVITVGVGLLGGFIALMVQSMVVVPHSRVVVIERFGKYHRTLVPGLHRRWPIIERRRALVDLSPRVVDLTEPIVVRVVFASDNPQRISIADTAPITVGPIHQNSATVAQSGSTASC